MNVKLAPIVFLAFCLIGLPAWGGTSSKARTKVDKLRQDLLNEILAGNPKKHADGQEAAQGQPVPQVATIAAKKTAPSAVVGADVANVLTWPVVGLIILLGAVLWWFKRGRPGQLHSGAIQKLACVPLGGKRSLALVDVLGHKLVLGLGDKSLNLLTRIEGDHLGQPCLSEDSKAAQDEFFENELCGLMENREANDNVEVGAGLERQDLVQKFKRFRDL